MTTTFVDVIHTETGVRGEVSEAALALWLTRGYEVAPDDGEGNSEQPFPYVRRIGDLSGSVDLAELAALLELASGGAVDIPAVVAAAIAAADFPTTSEVETIAGDLVSAIVSGAPGALDTLNELAAALGDDPNFATTILDELTGRLSDASLTELFGLGVFLASSAFTGGVVDATAHIQGLIDAASAAGGGGVWLRPGSYSVTTLNAKPGVTLRSSVPQRGYQASGGIPDVCRLIARDGAGYLIDSDAAGGGAHQFGVHGIDFNGSLGVNNKNGGIRIRGSYGAVIKECTFAGFQGRAISIEGGTAGSSVACRLYDILVSNCLQGVQTAANGAVYLAGTDHILNGGQIGVERAAVTAEKWCNSVMVAATECFISDVGAEFGDNSWWVTGSGNRFVNCRGDKSFCNDWVISGGAYNQLIGCSGLDGGRSASGTFASLSVQGYSNTIIGYRCRQTGTYVGNQYSYMIDDSIVVNNAAEYRTTIIGCEAFNCASGKYLTAGLLGAGAPVVPAGCVRPVAGTTTPNVEGYSYVLLTLYTSATTITNFLGGHSGQVLTVIGDADVTIANNATIKTVTGANLLLAADRAYVFIYHNGVWIQQGGTIGAADRAAITAEITAAITALINAAPGALDTLDELAAALGDDANFAATVTAALAAKAPLASPAFTGNASFASPQVAGTTTHTASTALTLASSPYNRIDCTAGAVALSLPGTVVPGVEFVFRKVDKTANLATVTATLIDGTTTFTLRHEHDAVTLRSTTTSGTWEVVSRTDKSRESLWKPSDNKLLACNFPPRSITASRLLVTNTYQLNKIRVPAGVTITNVLAYITAAGSGLTSAAAAVYETDGTKVGETASQTAGWGSTGLKTMALGAPIAAQDVARDVWVAYAAAGTTLPQMGMSSTFATANFGMVAADKFNAGYVSLALPFTGPLNMAALNDYFEFWAGIS